MRKVNQFVTQGETTYLLCPTSNGALLSVPVDSKALPQILGAGFWRVAVFCPASGKVYAYASYRSRVIYLHRLLASPEQGLVVDHINCRGTDNRRSNLRNTTARMNQLNRRVAVKSKSGVRGVVWSSRWQKWIARVDNKDLGKFNEIADARKVVEAHLRKIGVTA